MGELVDTISGGIAVAKRARLVTALTDVWTVLSAEGIPALALGSAAATAYGVGRWPTTSEDIDLLLTEDGARAAQGVLKANDFAPADSGEGWLLKAIRPGATS